MFDIDVWIVLLAAGITAVATGIGAFPFLFVRDLTRLVGGNFQRHRSRPDACRQPPSVG